MNTTSPALRLTAAGWLLLLLLVVLTGTVGAYLANLPFLYLGGLVFSAALFLLVGDMILHHRLRVNAARS